YAGGLVGQNGVFGFGTGTITSSFATGDVIATGLNAVAGGLAAVNNPGSTITDSQATGAVTPMGSGSASPLRLLTAGGLVGLNLGTITSTIQPGAAASCTTGASFSCASGSVSVTAFGQGGGLVGSNQGTIASSFATGAVIGGPGG